MGMEGAFDGIGQMITCLFFLCIFLFLGCVVLGGAFLFGWPLLMLFKVLGAMVVMLGLVVFGMWLGK